MAVIFLILIASVISVGVNGSKNGQMDKILAPLDGDGKFCGMNEEGYDYSEYKYLMFTGIDSGSVTSQTYFELYRKAVCVKNCPTATGDQPECKDLADV